MDKLTKLNNLNLFNEPWLYSYIYPCKYQLEIKCTYLFMKQSTDLY